MARGQAKLQRYYLRALWKTLKIVRFAAAAADSDPKEQENLGRDEDNHKSLHDVQGMLPLHWSCLCGHLGVTNLLISKNSMIDTEDEFGRTPAMLAASSGNLQILKVGTRYS